MQMIKLTKPGYIGTVATVSIYLSIGCFISCFSLRSRNTVAKVKFVFNLPILKTNGEVINVKDSVYIFNQNNNVVLKLLHTNLLMDNGGAVSETRKPNYFAYEKTQSLGLLYDPDSSVTHVLRVDSVLKSKVFGGTVFFNFNEQRLVSKQNNNGKIIIEKYIPKIKRDESYPDSVFLSYSSRFRDIDFSLSEFMDSIRNSKVYKISFRFNQGLYPGVAVEIPSREILFELKEVSDHESTEISSLFDRFNREKRKLLLDTVKLDK